MAEFAIAISLFLMLVMGAVDLGRAVYQYNGVAQAARELARVTSVHPGATLGSSTETTGVLAVQRGLVPSLGTATYTCIDITGTAVTGTCHPGSWVRVTIQSTFTPATPLATVLDTIVLSSTASARIE